MQRTMFTLLPARHTTGQQQAETAAETLTPAATAIPTMATQTTATPTPITGTLRPTPAILRDTALFP